ncbi:MAG: TonB family protein [Bacteroidetes bacterium]|nr:TonB family protein [Bacteroidota bacterium]
MNTNFNSVENLTELVFENKNKAYGAYAIRKSYSESVTKSLALSSTFFLMLALFAISLTNKKIEIPDLGLINDPYTGTKEIVVVVQPKDPIVKPIEKPQTTPVTSSGQLTASDDPKNTVNKTNEQQNISKNPNPFGSDTTAAVNPEIKTPEIPVKIPEALRFVEKMPKYDNMAQFIADNLKYPRIAVDNGTEGTVYVTFVVEKDGKITDIKLLRGIGDGCEQEAMRVVGMMPLWEPGTQKNIPQRVQCNLPIRFTIK